MEQQRQPQIQIEVATAKGNLETLDEALDVFRVRARMRTP